MSQTRTVEDHLVQPLWLIEAGVYGDEALPLEKEIQRQGMRAAILDVCESAGRFWLVELNSFSSSWLYQCELAAVVAEASREAAREWARNRRETVPASLK
jgi:hypothetical protein